MIPRQLKLPRKQHFFLFGGRGTGKTTLLRKLFADETTCWINLLSSQVEDTYSRNPDELISTVKALPKSITHVVIDEIQKVPKLLDLVHHLIESECPQHFILTGSSARKLKYGGANLLAGRAFVYHLFPLSRDELAEDFKLDQALAWGTLPRITSLENEEEFRHFLNAYTLTYLKEEVWGEHLIRKLDPFRRFLDVAAQMNGKIINYAGIARDVGVDDKTVAEYFSLLEDTLLGFMLEPFHNSFRKRLNQKPKFYFFDTGVARSLAHLLSLPIKAGTSYYGELFEHFIILECHRLASYHNLDYRFSFLRTKDKFKIDCVVERPGKPILFIEIKSATDVRLEHVRALSTIRNEFENCETVCFCRAQQAKKYDDVWILPWQEGLKRYFAQ